MIAKRENRKRNIFTRSYKDVPFCGLQFRARHALDFGKPYETFNQLINSGVALDSKE